ncbi:hypothetical protein Lgra_1614 [Legionella gratiana]|uniref:Uncharacterized protein n=1 Tax=Legionella gratiana TaxID=45066 RepID=A0A378J751_9GAMM|nr:hypothetical protein [Legionella gratiana]KTD10648.1 hypothetical protein Lgra_1614 [Legionella gratiana]STX43613.1 Uncharacterised protein [Legionella gratiana]
MCRYKLDKNLEVLVSPAEKEVLMFCKKSLPEDVVQALFNLNDVSQIIAHLQKQQSSGQRPHWGLNSKLTSKYQWEEWFGTEEALKLDKLLGKIKEEKKFEEEKTQRYEDATSNYKNYLEKEIKKEINKITDKNFLSEVYGQLIKTQFNAPAPLPDDIKWAKKMIACNLINQYDSKHNVENINQLFSHKPKIVDALKKHQVITEASKKLDKSPQEFLEHLKENKKILTKRRDSGLETFIKALGVGAAAIIGIGVGGYFAYKHLFGSKATEGDKLLNEVSDIRESRPKT